MVRAPEQVIGTRKRDGLYRYRQTLKGPQGAQITLADGRQYLNFCSNDYLGLAAHPEISQAFARGLEQYGTGAGASHLICGHSEPHQALEESVSEQLKRERSLVFSCGYMANLGVISAFSRRDEPLFMDRLNHASLIDGAILSRSRLIRYPHRDVDSLQQLLLKNSSASGAMIATDGVFSMDGDLAPLPQMVELAQKHRALLYVDDAHGFGVLGQTGLGTVEHFGLTATEVPLLMCTFGKAVGVSGAVVSGSEEQIEMLLQLARTGIYTTAMPPAQAVAIKAALELLQRESWRRRHLCQLIDRFCKGTARLGYTEGVAGIPIQAIHIGSPEQAQMISAQLAERGLLVVAIRPPTVPAGTARLRVTLTAQHSEADVDRLLEALAECLN